MELSFFYFGHLIIQLTVFLTRFSKKFVYFKIGTPTAYALNCMHKRKEDAGQKPGIPPNSRKTNNHIPRKYSIEQSVTQTII